MNNAQVLDYTGVITLAGALALGLVTLIESIHTLPASAHNAILRIAAFVLTLAGVLYLNWSVGSLDLQHSALLYLGVAAGLPALHIAYVASPPSGNGGSAPTPSAPASVDPTVLAQAQQASQDAHAQLSAA